MDGVVFYEPQDCTAGSRTPCVEIPAPSCPVRRQASDGALLDSIIRNPKP